MNYKVKFVKYLVFIICIVMLTGVLPLTAVLAGDVTYSLNYVDLKNWTAHGDGVWELEPGGRTVRQTRNGNPAFYLSPDEYINKVITGTIKVDTTADDDMIGFVMGYQEPTDIDEDLAYYYDFILFDWKQIEQTENNGSYDLITKTSAEGFTLEKFTGELTNEIYFGGLGPWSKYFWFHVQEDNKNEVLATDYGPGKGWADINNTEYKFQILYTTDRIKIKIDDQVVFDETGSFQAGKIGFYNNSQSQVVYGNVQSASGTSAPVTPKAQGDRYGISKGTVLSVDRYDGVLFNDYDPNLDSYTIQLVDDVNDGILNLDTGTGGFSYDPADTFTGTDSFTYKLVQGPGVESNTVTVLINVIEGVNVAPADINLTNTYIHPDWANGTTVGTLSTVDPNIGDFHDYMLLDNAGGKFGIIDNTIIINNISLIGAGGLYNISVRSTDFQGAVCDRQFVIEALNKVTFENYDRAILETAWIRNGNAATAPDDPAKPGYSFTGWNPSDFTNIAGDSTITAQYAANTDTQYRVEHYKQNVDGSGYILLETENLTGTTDTTATAVLKAETGFTENTTHIARVENGTISADGSLTLKLYYDRDTYTVTFDTSGDNTMNVLGAGYSPGTQETLIITITSTGTRALTNLQVDLSGADVDAFEITQPIETLLDDATPSTTFTVQAKNDLAAGSYRAVVTITAANMVNESFTVTQQINSPDVPTIHAAVAGDSSINIEWSPVAGATGYKVYISTIPGSYSMPAATVGESFSSYNADGLTNGIEYYFVVRTVMGGSDSSNSNETSEVPGTVPSVPTNVTASAGNGKAVVNFEAPADNGGRPVTGYIVVAYPGSIIAAGTDTTVTVDGLTNGISYTFTVKAVNDEFGSSAESTASNAVMPYWPSSGSSSPSEEKKPGVDVLINGKAEKAATSTTIQDGNKSVTTIIIDDDIIHEQLEKESNNTVLTITDNKNSDVVSGTLNGQTVKKMEEKEAVLEIRTGNITYTIPATEININKVLEKLGENVELKDITVNVTISRSNEGTVKIVEDTANKNNYQLVIKSVEFEITCTSGNKTVEVSRFNSYVERTVAIPDGIDPGKITTAVILNSDGTFTHVPTSITIINGRYYAEIKSLTNSTYTVIWSPKAFSDVENHWAKDDILDMSSRLVIDGVGNGKFEPEKDINRAEFSEVVTKALGLMRPGTGKTVFSDVEKDKWYYDSVSIAYEYGIIFGYGNGIFGPMDKITREQAMTMIARAMKITGLKVEFKVDEADKLLAEFGDSEQATAWAKESMAACVKAGIISGKSGKALAPKDTITRAEVAVIVRRLLQKSGLI